MIVSQQFAIRVENDAEMTHSACHLFSKQYKLIFASKTAFIDNEPISVDQEFSIENQAVATEFVFGLRRP